ncbi:yabJ protein [Kalaharituber pfeilii]|nr:yabJ protein [Kalaharituber pfeilii]
MSTSQSSQKTVVNTTSAPSPFPGIFNQAIVHNGLVYSSGCIGIDPATNALVGPGIGERTTQALKNLQAVLEAAGSGLDKVVKATVYITDINNFATVNNAWREVFKGLEVPARTCVAVHQLALRTDIEIECIAHL